MADFYDIITPAELTGYARQALADRADNQFSLLRWLPNRPVNDLVYRFRRGAGGLIEAAQYRAYGAEPGFGAREGISRVTGELPPIGRQMILGEYDHLRLRNNNTEEMRDLFLRDGVRLARSIDARLELARGDALVNASVTIAEKGLKATVDFARDASMKVTAAVLWSSFATAPLLDDLELWIQAYSDLNGQPPGALLTSRRVVRAMVRNDQLHDQLFPNSPNRRVNRADLNSALEDEGIPSIVTYEAQVSRRKVATRIIPDNVIILLPAQVSPNPQEEDGELGATLWGTTAEATEPGYRIAPADHPGLVVAAFKESKTPVHAFTIASAIGIPIMANPNLAMVATVL